MTDLHRIAQCLDLRVRSTNGRRCCRSFCASFCPTGELNLTHCVCCVYQNGSSNAISESAAFILLFRAAFSLAYMRTCYLVSKYTAEFINLFELLDYSKKRSGDFFFPAVLISCCLPKCTVICAVIYNYIMLHTDT